MSTINIPCPSCGAVLRLKDRGLLGRRGKCPKCEHRFVLEEPKADPDEVELELVAETTAPAAPAVGTGAQWVPDDPAAPMINTAPAVPAVGIKEPDKGGTERLAELKRKNAKRRKLQIAGGGIVALLLVGTFFLVQNVKTEAREKEIARQKAEAKRKGPKQNMALVQEKKDLEQAKVDNDADSPTNGEFIKLLFMPAGARLVVHLRPADLWGDEVHFQEFRACLGTQFGPWIETKLKEYAFYSPKEIEEVTVCYILGPRGTRPDIAMLVRLKNYVNRSELLQHFKGTPDSSNGYKLYRGEKYTYAIDNEDVNETGQARTFAVAPSLMMAEMAEFQKGSPPTSDGIERLLLETDRDRHFTVLFEPRDLRIHQDYLVGENVVPALNSFLNWFGDDVETICWSVHLGDPGTKRPFFSEMLVRNSPITKPERLHRMLDKNLDSLSEKMWLQVIAKMNPKTLGMRHIIGRFPAMIEAISLSTNVGIDERFVQLTTRMDERAGPNLTAAVMLTWDESTRTDFTKAAPVNPGSTPANLPELVVDRLKKVTEVEFARVPLQEAFAYLGEEASVGIIIDGDALKDAGYTKNMPQNFTLGEVPAMQGIKQIVTSYPKPEMCIVIDQPNKSIIVTTTKFAMMKGQTPYKFE